MYQNGDEIVYVPSILSPTTKLVVGGGGGG